MSKEKSLVAVKQIFAVLFGAGADINRPNKSGYPPLFFACKQKKPEHVEYLLELGADIDRKGSNCGTTALMQACCGPSDEIVNNLLQRNADTTVTNYHGLTALALACVNNRLNHVKALITNIEIALELLAAEEYYPRNLAAKSHSRYRMDNNTEIENKLLKHFKFEALEQLYIVMHWAVSNDALELARKCIDHNQEVLQWSREGDTWLHVASDNGAMRIVELLLEKVTEKPDQTAEWATAEAIMKQNGQGDSPLTISIDQRHDEIQNLFWSKIRPLRNTDPAFIKMYSTAADWILELLARYEKPGHEDILKDFLQGWYDGNVKGADLDNALHWAIRRRKVVVVWWLLSKGGYSSRDAIESAERLVPGPYKENEICGYMRALLLHPPPLLDHIPNPNKEHIPSFQVGVSTANEAGLNSPGNIVDILSDRKSISIRYAQSSIHDIIYGAGPESVMKNAKEDLRQRDLNALRKALRNTVLEKGNNGHKPLVDETSIPDWVKSLSYQQDKDDQEEVSDGNSRDLLVRWIHLPVNELHLMQDLVSRLSYDSKRSEIDYMALMKHFNRSWSELAAGAERYYMKPQCVDPIEVFRESIRDVANQETSLFREFLDGLRREARGKQGQPADQKLNYKPQGILNRYHVISSETELLDAIRDIRDELHMLRSLAEDQEIVWQQAFASPQMGSDPQRLGFYTPTEVKKDLDAMLLEADKIEGYINALLDLRQAEFGRLQAQDSAQLSNVILVLTVITIVFVSLS
ncbi:hypothetical protein ONZ43_g1966 [Nemania bipapillata]|uniref:Uncharacterized protein n=1 Tax=Nemania bipapillata TaxID=110536 RepID=A0ACC2J2C0_9PEZI|nr:hypothetical protein ONZ43_g1966 [Nemania bipapillata]